MSEALIVWHDQERVARLILSPDRRMAFTYEGDWLRNGWPISCSLPLTETGDFLPPDMRGHHFFGNLLPEGGARERLVHRLGMADDDFLLLARLGGDCAGALQVLPEGEQPSAPTGSGSWHVLDSGLLLNAIRTGRGQWLEGEEPPRLSLAGAQDKLAVRARRLGDRWEFLLAEDGAASTHILKLPVQDLRNVPLYEAYTTFLAVQLGLPVAPVEPVRLGEHFLSISKRFDRVEEDGVIYRLHQEDLCQAQGVSRAEKYRDTGRPFAALADLLREYSTQPARDLRALAGWQVFNALVGNADAHLKNVSLLADGGGGWQLAPFYDLVCTLAIPQVSHMMALPIGGKRDPQNLHRNHWDDFARELGVAPRLVQRLIHSYAERLLDNAEEWLGEFEKAHGPAPALQNVQKIVTQQCRKALRDWV